MYSSFSNSPYTLHCYICYLEKHIEQDPRQMPGILHVVFYCVDLPLSVQAAI